MRLIRRPLLIVVAAIVSLLLQTTPGSEITATSSTRIYLDISGAVYAGDNFTVRVCVSAVSNFKAYQIQISYDKTKIRLLGDENGESGVSPGLIGNIPVAVGVWGYIPAGNISNTVRIVGCVDDTLAPSVSGSGYLAELNFRAVGAAGSKDDIIFSESDRFQNGLFNGSGKEITVQSWDGGQVNIIVPIDLQISGGNEYRGAAGVYFEASFNASGGYQPYIWKAEGLPEGLEISSDGRIYGYAMQSGLYTTIITLSDDYSPAHTDTEVIILKIYPLGDADENWTIDRWDVRKIIKIWLEVDPATAAADTNGDGVIDLRDAVQIEKYYLSY